MGWAGTARCLLVVGSMLAAAPPPAAGELDLRLQSRAAVNGARVTVGDVTQPAADPGAIWDEIRGVPVGWAPAPGKTSTLSAGDLRRALREHGSAAFVGRIQGGPCRVVRPGQELAGDTLAARARAAVTRWTGTVPGTELVRLEPPGELVLPQGVVEIEAEIPGRPPEPGLVVVPVAIRVNGDVVRRVMVTCRLVREVTAPVAVTPLPRHHGLEPEDVRWTVLRWTQPGASFPSAPEALQGKRLRRGVRAGTVLRADLLEESPTVRRGEPVVLSLTRGALSLAVEAWALEDGQPGQLIRCRNPFTRQELRARVSGPGIACIEPITQEPR